MFGDEIALIVIILRFEKAKFSPGTLALLFGLGMLPGAFISGYAGRLVDRRSTKPILIGTGFISALFGGLMVLADSPAPLLACYAGIAICNLFDGLAWQVLIPHLVDTEEETIEIIAFLRNTGTLAQVIGPAIAAALVALIGAKMALGLNAATFLVIPIAALLIRRHRDAANIASIAETVHDNEKISMASVFRDPSLGILFAALTVLAFLLEWSSLSEVFLIKRVLHGADVAFGIFTAMGALGSIVGTWYIGRTKMRSTLITSVGVGAILISTVTLALGLTPWLPPVFPLAFMFGFSVGLISTAIFTMVTLQTAEHRRGRVFAAITGSGRIANFCGLVVAAFLLKKVQPDTVYVISGALSLTACLAAVRPIWRLRIRVIASNLDGRTNIDGLTGSVQV